MRVRSKKKEEEEEKIMIINDVKLNWLAIHAPDTMFEPQWKVTAVLTEEQAKTLKGQGLKVKKDDDGILSYNFKISCKTFKGEDNKQPLLVDENRVPITGGVGNGSIGNVQYRVYEYKQFGGGIACSLEGVQVTKLIPYSSGESEFTSVGAGTEFKEEESIDDVPF